jgi:hypothetical protein
MSQERIIDQGDLTNKRDVSDISKDKTEIVFSQATKSDSKVRVVHGANQEYFDLAGKTVGSVRKNLREIFNIPSDAEALISGNAVPDDFILEGGQSLEFLKESGVKG